MTPELIVGIVSAIIGVGFVKVWLYKLIKYKMDEGIVLKFFQDHKSGSFSVEEIATGADLKQDRVLKVCKKSDSFKTADDDNDKWVLG